MNRVPGTRWIALAVFAGIAPGSMLLGTVAAHPGGAPTAAAVGSTGAQDPAALQEAESTPASEAGADSEIQTADGQAPVEEQSASDPAAPAMPTIMNEVVATLEDIYNDVFFWGQSATVTGRLHDNAFLFGQIVEVAQGRVDGDLFTFAATTTIDGEVLGDVYAFTSNMRVPEGAVIRGNLICMCGGLQVDGYVAGKIWGGGGLTRIDGDVGSIDIETGDLRIGATARIRGDLAYEGNDEAEIADGARIEGDVRWNRTEDEEDAEDEEDDAPGPWISGWSMLWMTWRYLSGLIVGLAFLLLGGRTARKPAESLRDQPAWGLGYGFVVAVVVPVACAIAIVMIVSMPLGVITLLLFGIAVFLARLVTAQFFGDCIMRLLGRENPSEYAALAIGLAALLLARAIPYVGFLVGLFSIVLGLGGIYLAARGTGRVTAGATPSGGAVSEAP